MLVKLKKNSILLLILLGGGFIPVGAETFRIDGIYLVVNNQMLTRSEAIDTSKTLKTRIEQSNLSAGEKSKRLAELKNDLLKSLVQELLLLDRADALGLEPTEKEIEGRLDQIAENQPEVFSAYGEKELQEQLIRDFKKQRVISYEIESRIRTDEEELEQYCIEESKRLRKIGLSQILFRGDADEAREKALEVKKAFEEGNDFSSLAEKFSEDPSAVKTKGKLGFFSQGELLQSINDAAFLLNPGEMSPLVNSEFGFHLLYVFDEEFPENINCKKLTLDQKNRYADIVYGQEKDLLLQDYIQDLWACARIEVKDPLESGLPSIESLPNVRDASNPCRVRMGAIRERAMEKASSQNKKQSSR